MTFEVPGRFLSAFIKMADACGHIETTAEHLAAMLNSPDVDVVIALWRDPDAPGGLEGPESLRGFNPIPKHKSGKARIEAPSVNGKAHRPHTEALGLLPNREDARAGEPADAARPRR